MALTLHFHPLSSFCQKVLIALYENEVAFTPHIVDLSDPGANAAFRKLWPIGRFPVLRDDDRDRTVPESSVIIEYIAAQFPSHTQLLPSDPVLLRDVRAQDRFFDLYLNVPMQKVVTDRLRPPGRNDPHGVEQASELLHTALRLTDELMADRIWAVGESFTMADCAAAPPLFYADRLAPLDACYRHVAAYLRRLRERPSYARVLREAEPFLKMFPG